MTYDFICLGETTCDVFIKPHEAQVLDSHKKLKLHLPYEEMLCFSFGDKIEVEDVSYSLGGTACNVAEGLSKLGIKTGLMSFRGNDDFGKLIQKMLEKTSLKIEKLIIDKKIHSTYSFILRYKNDRTILVYRGQFDYQKLELKKIKNTNWLYLSSLGTGYEKEAIALAAEKNIKIAINPGKKQLQEKKKDFLLLLKLAEVVIINKEEAEILLSSRFPLQIKELYYRLADFGMKNCIITDGANGAYARDLEKNIWHIPAMRTEVLETTGAGDAFASGFLTRLLHCQGTLRPARNDNKYEYTTNDIKEALQWGIISSTKVIEKVGAQTGLLTKAELEKLIKKAPKVQKL